MKLLLNHHVPRPGNTTHLTKTNCLHFEARALKSRLCPWNSYGQSPQCHELCPAAGTAQAPKILLVSKQSRLKEQFYIYLKDTTPFRLG